MGLKFDPAASCLILGCTSKPTHKLSLRMRRQDSGADWAPDTEAYFCKKHATGGADITVLYAPTTTKEVRVDVQAVRTATRTTKITRA